MKTPKSNTVRHCGTSLCSGWKEDSFSLRERLLGLKPTPKITNHPLNYENAKIKYSTALRYTVGVRWFEFPNFAPLRIQKWSVDSETLWIAVPGHSEVPVKNSKGMIFIGATVKSMNVHGNPRVGYFTFSTSILLTVASMKIRCLWIFYRPIWMPWECDSQSFRVHRPFLYI